jgi:hypothetical protein
LSFGYSAKDIDLLKFHAERHVSRQLFIASQVWEFRLPTFHINVFFGRGERHAENVFDLLARHHGDCSVP